MKLLKETGFLQPNILLIQTSVGLGLYNVNIKPQTSNITRQVFQNISTTFFVKLYTNLCRSGCWKYLGNTPTNIKAVAEWPAPKHVNKLKRFIGFWNLCQWFINHSLMTTRPLHNLTKVDTTFVWDKTLNMTLKSPKTAFTFAPILKLYTSIKLLFLNMIAQTLCYTLSGLNGVNRFENYTLWFIYPNNRSRPSRTMIFLTKSYWKSMLPSRNRDTNS